MPAKSAVHVFLNFRRNVITVPAPLDDNGTPQEATEYTIPEGTRLPDKRIRPGELRISDAAEAARVIKRLGKWIDNDLLTHHTEAP